VYQVTGAKLQRFRNLLAVLEMVDVKRGGREWRDAAILM
jgi:hypothetical protein